MVIAVLIVVHFGGLVALMWRDSAGHAAAERARRTAARTTDTESETRP